MASNLREQLTGGNRTSIGEAQAVIQEILISPNKLKEIYALFFDSDPVVAMRSSYVAMRVAELNPVSVKPFKKSLLSNLEKFQQQEVRWHIPQLLNHLSLVPTEKKKAYSTIMNWAETDKSKIVAYYALQSAANFAETDPNLLEDFIPRLKKLNKSGAKSVSNRCKKIAKQLKIEL
jgi:hypothetical protein